MRLFGSLQAVRSKAIPEKDVVFEPRLPLKLRSFVSGKADKVSEVACVHEMSIMLACFKENEFSQVICSKEIAQFQKCYTSSLDSKRQRKEREAKGILMPGERKMSYKQVNKLLSMYPNTR